MQHLQALQTHRNTGTGRQPMLQSCEQCAINRPLQALPMATVRIVGFNSLPLFACVGQLDIAVGEFDRAKKYLKAIRDLRIRRAKSCKRRLACR